MITTIVGGIASAFSQRSALAFAAAILWGVMRVLLSPCHLGAIPIIVAYVNEGKRPGRRRVFFLSFLFALGLLVMLVVVGVVTSAAWRLLGDVGRGATLATDIFLILFQGKAGTAWFLVSVPSLFLRRPSSRRALSATI